MDQKTGRIDPASRQVIMEWQSVGHNGAALGFGKDGMLYVTSGDGTSNSDEWSSGQDLTRPLAKLLRIDVDHPADGKPYSIPSDNPFLKTPGARPETWAYGFRNPWRMTIDRPTGDIWVAENGQDLWEYARIAHRGENYGWPLVEGSHDFHQNRMPLLTPITKPLIEHSHTDFRSLTGGIVYRGTKFPELAGHYIYGDHSTGQIWAALQKDGKLVEDKQIARNFGITNFCETPQGDILVIDHLGSIISKLARSAARRARAALPDEAQRDGPLHQHGVAHAAARIGSLRSHIARLARWRDDGALPRAARLRARGIHRPERLEFPRRHGARADAEPRREAPRDARDAPPIQRMGGLHLRLECGANRRDARAGGRRNADAGGGPRLAFSRQAGVRLLPLAPGEFRARFCHAAAQSAGQERRESAHAFRAARLVQIQSRAGSRSTNGARNSRTEN